MPRSHDRSIPKLPAILLEVIKQIPCRPINVIIDLNLSILTSIVCAASMYASNPQAVIDAVVTPFTYLLTLYPYES